MALFGTGAGQPLGLVNAPCAISVAAETGQTSGIWYENIINMYSRSTNPGRSVWIINDANFPTLATMTLPVGTGGSAVWLPAGGAAGLPYNTLMGRPMYFVEQCSAPNTVGDIAFVDFSQILLGKKAGGDVPAFDTSIHLKFDYGQIAYRFQVRFDIRPWWRTYYTPPKATTVTKSPIVLLATRS
jgi:HK97 family phage major capsid protein